MFPLGPNIPDCFCLEHITALLEKNGLRVVPPSSSTQGAEGFKFTLCFCFTSGGSGLPSRTRDGEAGATGSGPAAPTPKSWSMYATGRLLTGFYSHLFQYLWVLRRAEELCIPVPCEVWLFFQVLLSLLYLSFQKSS